MRLPPNVTTYMQEQNMSCNRECSMMPRGILETIKYVEMLR